MLFPILDKPLLHPITRQARPNIELPIPKQHSHESNNIIVNEPDIIDATKRKDTQILSSKF